MGLNIKQAIKTRGLEVREVATRMGISPTGLSQHINGNPSVETLQRIADAIGCDIAELFDRSSDFIAFIRKGGQTYTFESEEALRGFLDQAKNNIQLP